MWGSSTGSKQRGSQGNRGGHHAQTQNQVQKMIVDQNYANNIVFMALSVLEQIHMKIEGNESKKKKYGYYDKANYDYKDLNELKSQFQVNLVLLKASKECFAQEYGQSSYKLPSQFNQGHVLGEVQKFQKYFQSKQEEDFYWLCNDFIKLMKNDFHQLSFERKNFTVQYSDSEKKKHQKELFRQGLDAADQMDKEKKKIEDLGSDITPETLPINIGKQEIFSQQNGSSSKMVSQEEESKNEMFYQNQNKMEKKILLSEWQLQQIQQWERQKVQLQNWRKQNEEKRERRVYTLEEYKQQVSRYQKLKQQSQAFEIEIGKWKYQALLKRQKQIKSWMNQLQNSLKREKQDQRFATNVSQRARYKKEIEKKEQQFRLAHEQNDQIERELFYLKQEAQKIKRNQWFK